MLFVCLCLFVGESFTVVRVADTDVTERWGGYEQDLLFAVRSLCVGDSGGVWFGVPRKRCMNEQK